MNAPKKRGTTFETAVVRCFDSHGVYAHRNAPAGILDIGDLTVPDWNLIVECKATRALAIAEAVDEAQMEALRAGQDFGLAVIKRRMANVGQSYAVMALDDFIRFTQARERHD